MKLRYLAVSLFFAGSLVAGQAAAPDDYKPSEVQSLKLQVKQKDVLLAQAAAQKATEVFQQSLAALSEEAENVKKENNWPKELTFDVNNLKFAKPVPPVKTKPETEKK